MNTVKSIMDPALPDTFKNLKDDIFHTLNCVKIGVIQSFDPAKATAQVQILFKRILSNGNIQSYPVLVDCPVYTPQGGGAYLQMPITKGDQCLILFADRNIDAWYKTGSEMAPFDPRCHDISDGLVIVGVNALTSSIPDFSSSEARLTYGGAKVGLSGGLITVRNAATSLLTVINGFIDVLKLTTDANNIPLSATTIAALEAYKVTVATLLY